MPLLVGSTYSVQRMIVPSGVVKPMGLNASWTSVGVKALLPLASIMETPFCTSNCNFVEALIMLFPFSLHSRDSNAKLLPTIVGLLNVAVPVELPVELRMARCFVAYESAVQVKSKLPSTRKAAAPLLVLPMGSSQLTLLKLSVVVAWRVSLIEMHCTGADMLLP